MVTHNALFVFEVCIVLLHRSVDGLECGYQVVEDGRTPCLALVLPKPTSVDDAHLLQHRRLSTLTGTCVASQSISLAPSVVMPTKQQELYLALRLLLVHTQILLNVLILLGLWVHWFSSKTHYRRCHVMHSREIGMQQEDGRRGVAVH